MARSGTPTKPRTAQAKAVKPIRTLKKTKSHRVRNIICGFLAGILSIAALLGTVSHILPAEIQAWPYVPIIVSLVPWFAILAVIALICGIVSKRTMSVLLAIAAIALQVWWQYPFFYNETKLPRAAIAAVSGASANTQDDYARLMTCNVFKGRADAQEIVDVVRSERVEVLALQETTDAFVDELNKAGIGDLLPYAQVASSDGVYGNGLWSASPLVDPADDDVDSSASFMPGATVAFNDGRTQIRFVSVHTTLRPMDIGSSGSVHWMSLVDSGTIRLVGTCSWAISTRPTIMHRSVISWEHGSRMRPNKRPGGLVFTWPANIDYVPTFAGIDHIVLDSGMLAGRVKSLKIDGSDHKALLATVQFDV